MVKKDEPVVGTEYTRWVYRSLLLGPDGETATTVQNPLPTDSDSVYAKDIDLENSDLTGWSGVITDLVDDLHTVVENLSSDNPKIFTMYFKRTINAHQVGIGCIGDNNFSNLKLVLLGSGDVERTVLDESADNTKYTSRDYQFEPDLFNAVRFEFYTSDPVCISNITIQKAINVAAQIEGIRPDGRLGTVNVTNGNNLKVSLEELETGVSSNNNTQLNVTQYLSNGNEGIKAADSASVDAFGRWRVSNLETVFDSKQTGEAAQIFWDDQEISGSGTNSIYSEDKARTELSVSNLTAGTRVRQTKQRFNYQPGKSQLIFMTFSFNGGSLGITKSAGYFDDNNGLMFENVNGTYYFTRRSSTSGTPVDNDIERSNWNIDPMDGTGPSGVNLDFTKTQILVIDIEWLGVGRVRMGWNVNGTTYYAHEFLNTNVLDNVYMSKPNLPLRYVISNDGTGPADSFDAICASVTSEGGISKIGLIRGQSTGNSGLSVSASNTYAAIGLRLKSTELDTTILIEEIDLLVRTVNDIFRWELRLNPTVAGTFTYNDLPMSAVQIALGNNTNTVTGGIILSTGLGKDNTAISEGLDNAYRLGSFIDGTSDEIVLCIYNYTSTATFDATIDWRELL